MFDILPKFSFFTLFLPFVISNSLKIAREQHRGVIASNSDLRSLSSLSDINYINKVLDNILIPRVVGTENHEKVFNYIKKELGSLKWQVEVDEFIDKTPIFGNLKFRNIIATHNPQAHRFLVLACHYDTKYFKNVEFVGAIDSAVPCAMMLEIAKTLTKQLKNTSNVALKLIFFDGEEAFKNWGPKDSIYGSRHLAKQLHNNRSEINGESVTELDKIDILVLLDLIGAKNPSFLSFFENTQRWFVRLSQIEYDLHRMGLLKNHRFNYFQLTRPYGHVDDDHVPFLQKNVPILHLITTPFPKEWHTWKDNRDIIDLDTVYNVNLILKVFISEYLHLFPEPDKTKNDSEEVLILINCPLVETFYDTPVYPLLL